MTNEFWGSIQHNQKSYLTINPLDQPQLQNSQAPMIMNSSNISIINLKVEKRLRIIEGFEQHQLLNVVPPYWYESNPYAFPMGTPIMPMNTKPMATLPIPIWNLMMYSMTGGVHPLLRPPNELQNFERNKIGEKRDRIFLFYLDKQKVET